MWWLLWLILGVAIGVAVMALMHMARDPITKDAANIQFNKDEINGEEY